MTTPPESSAPTSRICVFDVGARFGMHPTWRPLKGSPVLSTVAFEPDPHEVARLKEKYRAYSNYEVHAIALGNDNECRVLNLLSNRGFSSFLEPNTDEAWFGADRKGEGDLESQVSVQTRRLDDWCKESNVFPDFIKIDTEGYDFDVLRGADSIIENHVLGIRCEVFFRELFRGVKQIDSIVSYLRDKQYVLANLDYSGKGSPQSYFCPNERYGLLMGCEAVFIRHEKHNLNLPADRFLKLLIFLFLNYLEDLAIRYLKQRDDLYEHSAQALYPELWKTLEKLYLLGAKKLQWVPGSAFDNAKEDYARIFRARFPDMHRFYEWDFLNPA